MKRLIKWLIKLFVLFVILVLIFVLGVYFFTPSKYRILIIGSDQREGLHETDVSVKRGRSDVLMVMSVAKKSKDKFSILMIPRDTLVEDEEYGTQKMTHYYAMGERYESDVLGNLSLTQERIEELLDVKMHATFEVTFDGFIDIIELLGGVDTTEGHLDAEEAVEAVHNRFTQARGDFGRAEQQREILKSALAKVKEPKNAKAAYDYMSDSEQARLKYNKVSAGLFGVAYLIGHGGQIGNIDFEEVEVPGEGTRIGGVYYWDADEEELKEIKKQYLK